MTSQEEKKRVLRLRTTECAGSIWQEADELISIFITMSKNTKTNRSRK
jgi:hypothetical protein